MSLQTKSETKEKPKKKSSYGVILVAAVLFFLVTSAVIAISVGAYVASKVENSPQSQNKTYTTTTSTTSTSTSIVSTSTVPTTTSSLTTTTVKVAEIVCGGDGEDACRDLPECEKGLTRNSKGICVTLGCVPSVNSGTDGCGAFALSFCKGD